MSRLCRWAPFLLAATLVSCNSSSPQSARAEAARLRGSFEEHRSAYVQAIELENRLVPETLKWLNGQLTTEPRSQSASHVCRLTDRWARAFFDLRVIHGKFRFDKYESDQVRRVHHRILEHLKQRYFLLHDYQRYAQAACKFEFGVPPATRTPPNLEEFRQRLEAHQRSGDEVTTMPDGLPQ